MAFIPYEGMTLNLPTDNNWKVIVSGDDFIPAVNSVKVYADGWRTYIFKYWQPINWDGIFLKSTDESNWTQYQVATPAIHFCGPFAFGLHITAAGYPITTRYQDFGITLQAPFDNGDSSTPYAHEGFIQRPVVQNNSDITTGYCANLLCRKFNDYYELKFDGVSNYTLVTESFFFTPKPEPSNKYRVRPSWKSLIDPNDSAGESSSGGGNGTHDDTSDIITPAALPTVSAAQAGVITLFKPSLDNLKKLNSYLWTNVDDFVPNLQKMFSNPMDYIIAFNIFPVNPDVDVERKIKLGLWETTVKMPPILSQWYEFSCGSIFIPEYWGSALDYAPNTKISCMLPFIGSVQLNTDEVMGKSLDIKYRIDLLSGSCVAILSVNGSVYYQFTGECGVSIPLTGADWSRVYSAAIGAIGTAISGGMAAAGVGAATGAGMSSAAKMGNALANQVGMANKIDNAIKTLPRRSGELYNALKESQKSIMSNALNQAAKEANESRAISASRVASTVNNTVGNVMGGKVSIQHSGSISGSAGMLGVRRPFITIEYPNQSLAENYKHFVGYPSNIFAKLSDVSGYTECEQVIIENFPGTDGELAEVLEALKGGVYL